jgi:hypothetical protein
MSAPGVDRVMNIRGLLGEARSSLCIGYDSCERQMDPAKVLEALCSIECAIAELKLLDGNLQQEDAELAESASTIRELAQALQTKARPQ